MASCRARRIAVPASLSAESTLHGLSSMSPSALMFAEGSGFRPEVHTWAFVLQAIDPSLQPPTPPLASSRRRYSGEHTPLDLLTGEPLDDLACCPSAHVDAGSGSGTPDVTVPAPGPRQLDPQEIEVRALWQLAVHACCSSGCIAVCAAV